MKRIILCILCTTVSAHSTTDLTPLEQIGKAYQQSLENLAQLRKNNASVQDIEAEQKKQHQLLHQLEKYEAKNNNKKVIPPIPTQTKIKNATQTIQPKQQTTASFDMKLAERVLAFEQKFNTLRKKTLKKDLLSTRESLALDKRIMFIQTKINTLTENITINTNKNRTLQQLGLLELFLTWYNSIALKLEFLTVGNNEIAANSAILQQALNQHQLQKITAQVIIALTYELENFWVRLNRKNGDKDLLTLEQIVNHTNNTWLSMIVLNELPNEQNMSWWEHVVQKTPIGRSSTIRLYQAITYDLEEKNAALLSQYMDALTTASNYRTATDQQLTIKKVITIINTTITNLENKKYKLLQQHVKRCWNPARTHLEYDLLDFFVAKLIMIKRSCQQYAQFEYNNVKADSLIQHNILCSNKQYQALLNNKYWLSKSNQQALQEYFSEYTRIVETYLYEQWEKITIMHHLYALINELIFARSNYARWGAEKLLRGEDPYVSLINDMIVILENIAQTIKEPTIKKESIMDQILSGSWLSHAAHNNSLLSKLESILDFSGQKNYKKMALMALASISPVLAIKLIRSLQPFFSSEVNDDINNILMYKRTGKISPDDSQKIVTVIKNNPEILKILTEKEPKFLEQLAKQIQKHLQK